ncbi:MAG: RNA methyltransferase [Oscillospiraceae bacterium]|nr:RNA methyltransferase [Oscillospiraceae bacterium]
MGNEKHISELAESPWQAWLTCSETQLAHLYEPEPGLFIAESANVIERAIAAGYQPEAFLIDPAFYREQVRAMTVQLPDVPVYLAAEPVLNSIRGMHLTRGVLCAMRRRRMQMPPSAQLGSRIVILENIVNPTNLGAIFRSAAALGMDAVLLTKGCTDPLYRRAARVSTGTVFQIPWFTDSSAETAVPIIRALQSSGYICMAMALNSDSVSLSDPRLREPERLAVVMGNEGSGLCAETVSACDYTVRIPMLHGVDSLNVAAASAVAFWELRRRS